MNINELEAIMKATGLTIRAIPLKVRKVLEKCHVDDYPEGEIVYLDEYKREMLVVYTTPQNAGKFMVEENSGTRTKVMFNNQVFFDSIEEAVKHVRIKHAKVLWYAFGDVPMDPETEEIETDWHVFPKGTHREDVWHWFEETFNLSVAEDLMYAE